MRLAILSLFCALLCACGGIYNNLCDVNDCGGGLTCQDADAVIRNLGTVTGYACLPVTGQAGQRSTVFVVPSACTPNIRVTDGKINEVSCPITLGKVKIYEQPIRPLPPMPTLRAADLRDNSPDQLNLKK